MGLLHHQRFRIRLPCCIWEETNLAWITLWYILKTGNVGGQSGNKRLKSSLSTPWRHIQAEEVQLHTFLASALEGGQWSSARPLSTGKDSRWNVMAHGAAREWTWRRNWRMVWVASTLHTTSEYGVSSITTANAHTSAVSSRLNWRPRRCKWTRPFRRKTKSGFCECAITFQLASTHWTREWVSPTDGLDNSGLEKIYCPCRSVQPRTLQPVAGRYNRLSFLVSPED